MAIGSIKTDFPVVSENAKTVEKYSFSIPPSIIKASRFALPFIIIIAVSSIPIIMAEEAGNSDACKEVCEKVPDDKGGFKAACWAVCTTVGAAGINVIDTLSKCQDLCAATKLISDAIYVPCIGSCMALKGFQRFVVKS